MNYNIHKSKLFGNLYIMANLTNVAAEQKNIGIYLPAIYVLVILPLSLLLHTTGSYYITSENDFFSSYQPHAEELLNGKFYIDVYRGPLYVLLLASVKLITGSYLSAGIIISAASSGMFLYFIYSCIKKVFTIHAAFIAIILTILNPVFIVYSYAPGTDMFFAALCSASVYFFLGSGTTEKIKIIYASAFAALAFLTRYNALFLFSIPMIIFIQKYSENTIRKKLILALIFMGIFVAVTAPWGIYTYVKKGEVFYNENYKNVAISLGDADKIKWEEAWSRYSGKYNSLDDIIKKEPGLVIKTLTSNLLYHFYNNMVVLNTLYIGVLALIGLIFIRIKKLPERQLSFYIINLSFFILLLPVFYDVRFSLFLIPCMAVFAYKGIKLISDTSRLSFSIILAGIICIGIVSIINYNKPIIEGQPEIRAVIDKFPEVIKDNKKSTIASRMPHISYHLNMNWKLLPADKTVAEAISALKKMNVDYLYFSMREYNEREMLRSLADPGNAPPELTPVIYLPEEKVVLYKINNL